MSAKTKDPLFLAMGGLAIIATSIWAVLQQSQVEKFQASVVPPNSGTPHEAAAVVVTAPESKTWAAAIPQSAGEKWLYDVFTPPKIYYNTRNKQFTVIVPSFNPEEQKTTPVPLPEEFGVELVKVEQPLYRLQLVGYVGEGPSARGTFENQLTKEIIFAKTGKKIPELNLEIVQFAAERRRVQMEGGTSIVETVAGATVKDTQTGAEVVLDSKVRKLDGPIVVTLKLTDGSEKIAKSGDTFVVGDYSYALAEVVLDPPSVTVTKTGVGLDSPEKKVLVIAQNSPDSSAQTKSTPPQEAPVSAFPGF